MKAIILAGGSGTRLWPLSRTRYPKQFLKIGGENSFLQQAILRNLLLVSKEDLLIVTNAENYHDVLRQVREIEPLLESNILLEPVSRNTAPAMAFAALYLKEIQGIDSGEILFISPADHLFEPEEEFVKAVKKGCHLAEETKGLITFGVAPTRPETGYGYLQVAGQKVERFVEKPDLKTAEEYLKKGNYLWNSGMFMFSLGSFEKELSSHAPQIASAMTQGLEAFEKSFSSLPNISLDYAIMEKSKEVFVVPLTLSWSDVGSWENVYEMLPKDGNANATMGRAEMMETKGTLVLADSRLVATLGVEDLLVIETEDVVLITKKSESQKVKALVEQLKSKGCKQTEEHTTIYRPWGAYTVIEEGNRYKIKKISVAPLQKLSLQLHYHRSEHWVVVKGTAKVTIGDQESIVHEGQSIFVPKSAVHRVENPGKVPLEIIEVQVGEYLGEDDIVRLEDVYGRLKEEDVFNLLLNTK